MEPGRRAGNFYPRRIGKEFRLEKVQKGGAVFNKEKFDWVNKEHIKLLGAVEAQNRIKNYWQTKRFPMKP